MSPRTLPLFVLASLLSFSSLACVVRTRPAPVYAEDDVEYVEPDAGDGEVVVVDQQPPDDQVEDPGTQPSRRHVWVRGRWMRTSQGWAWRRGHWVVARSDRAWVPGHWVKRHHRWVWVKGHWNRRR